MHKALGDSIEEAGGSAANTMAGLASLGARAVFLGKVRDDALGARFGESLKSLGVDFTTAPAIGGSSTASSMIAVTPDGQRSMNTYLGACREMTPGDVDENEVAAAKILYIEGYLWDADAARRRRARRYARRRNPAPKARCRCPTVSASAVSAMNSWT